MFYSAATVKLWHAIQFYYRHRRPMERGASSYIIHDMPRHRQRRQKKQEPAQGEAACD
jgi:hypothetical protein